MYFLLIHIDSSELFLLKSKDKKAFERLYDSTCSMMYGLALKISKRKILAEDIMHDSYVKIWKNISNFDEERSSLLTWMTQIVRNTAIDSLRNSNNKHIQSDDMIVYFKDVPVENPKIDAIGLSELVKNLKPEYQEVINILYYQGFTHQEASEYLDIPLGTLKTRARTALSELKLIFGKNEH
ncbi:MAG: sigma-70 family RNA polymerase sigma factor [Saprospiraceae bacterium]|nr:sigma-70 family RNA polymerase sigma factor [Saprospiraceae bacterium]